MLHHPTCEGLRALRFDGLAEAFAELEAGSAGSGLSPTERLGLMAEREALLRDTKRMSAG